MFDVIISDPPYKPKDLDLHLAFKLSKHLKNQGIFILSAPVSQQETVKLRSKKHPELELLSYKKYADGSLYFYRKS
jgi:16S rRNA G966 N2-methylase RsmD